jgi:hypothetical protein
MVHFRRDPRPKNRRAVAGCNYIGTVSADPNSQGFTSEFRFGGMRERAQKPKRNDSKEN